MIELYRLSSSYILRRAGSFLKENRAKSHQVVRGRREREREKKELPKQKTFCSGLYKDEDDDGEIYRINSSMSAPIKLPHIGQAVTMHHLHYTELLEAATKGSLNFFLLKYNT